MPQKPRKSFNGKDNLKEVMTLQTKRTENKEKESQNVSCENDKQ